MSSPENPERFKQPWNNTLGRAIMLLGPPEFAWGYGSGAFTAGTRLTFKGGIPVDAWYFNVAETSKFAGWRLSSQSAAMVQQLTNVSGAPVINGSTLPQRPKEARPLFVTAACFPDLDHPCPDGTRPAILGIVTAIPWQADWPLDGLGVDCRLVDQVGRVVKGPSSRAVGKGDLSEIDPDNAPGKLGLMLNESFRGVEQGQYTIEVVLNNDGHRIGGRSVSVDIVGYGKGLTVGGPVPGIESSVKRGSRGFEFEGTWPFLRSSGAIDAEEETGLPVFYRLDGLTPEGREVRFQTTLRVISVGDLRKALRRLEEDTGRIRYLPLEELLSRGYLDIGQVHVIGRTDFPEQRLYSQDSGVGPSLLRAFRLRNLPPGQYIVVVETQDLGLRSRQESARGSPDHPVWEKNSRAFGFTLTPITVLSSDDYDWYASGCPDWSTR